MLFNLYVTRRNGTEFKTLRSPYASRDATIQTVTALITEGGPSGLSTTDAVFARKVSDAPIGMPVHHGESGLTFRTERTTAP